jgi:cobalt-zinc-cadmium efflux system protein
MPHHHHHHHNELQPEQLGRAFGLGIGLNILYVVVEVAAGLLVGSLALLTDAGHNLSDVFSLVLSWVALRLTAISSTRRFSYGYRKFTIWASLINGLLLLAAVVIIAIEAFHRFTNPPEIPGLTVSLVAFVGIGVNTFTAWLFHKDARHDLNVKGAYLHMAADAAVSAGVVVSGLLMYWLGWRWIDPAISLVIIAVIIWGTWGLLRESICLALDGVPQDVDPEAVKKAALETPGVIDVHHLHIWAISTFENALTAHLVLENGYTPEQAQKVKSSLRHTLSHMNIQHATLETEASDLECGCVSC